MIVAFRGESGSYNDFSRTGQALTAKNRRTPCGQQDGKTIIRRRVLCWLSTPIGKLKIKLAVQAHSSTERISRN